MISMRADTGFPCLPSVFSSNFSCMDLHTNVRTVIIFPKELMDMTAQEKYDFWCKNVPADSAIADDLKAIAGNPS